MYICRNNRARGRLTRRCNIPEEGLFCKLKYRANIIQHVSLFIPFPSKFLSLFAVRINVLFFRCRWRLSLQNSGIFMGARGMKTSPSGSSDNI